MITYTIDYHDELHMHVHLHIGIGISDFHSQLMY